MTPSPKALSTLIAHIYDCGAEREQWQAFLAELAALMRADKAHLFCLLPSAAQESFWMGHRISPRSLADYRSYYHSCDVLLQTAAKKSLFVAGRALADGAIMDKRLLKRSEFYHDFWRADGILHACAGLVFDQHSAPIPPTVLGLYRGPERPPFGRKDERLVELLIPHLQRALRIALQINGARMLSAVCDRMFEASPSVMAVCSRDGRLLYANARMERILGEQDGLTYREGRVAVLRERDHEAFLRALAACAEPPVVAAPLEDALQIHRRSGKAAYAVRVHRVPGWDRLFGLGIQAVACLQITESRRDPAGPDRDPATPLWPDGG